MHFALDEDQEALQEAARDFLAELPGPLSMTEQGQAYDADAWARLVEEQGFPAIAVPEEAGGWGYGLFELAIVFEEAGRAMTPSPLFGTVALGVVPIVTCGTPAQQGSLLEPLLTGGTATAALDVDVRVTRFGGAWTLSGTARRVVDGHSADLVLVPTEAGVLAVDGDAIAQRVRRDVLDTSRPLADLVFDEVIVPDERVLTAAPWSEALRRARVLLAAESVGTADAALQTAVDYAKVREQYGQAIGRFQAVQHLLADVCLAVEEARAATWLAAATVDTDSTGLDALTAAALAGDALFQAAGQSIQVHGGVGFTWECVAHMHFKRARASRALLGEPADHRRAAADAVLGGA